MPRTMYNKHYYPLRSAIPRDDIPVDYRVRNLDDKLTILIRTLMLIHGDEFVEKWHEVLNELDANGYDSSVSPWL